MKYSFDDLSKMSDQQVLNALERGGFIDPTVMAYLKQKRPRVLADLLLDQMNDPNVFVSPLARQWLAAHANQRRAEHGSDEA